MAEAASQKHRALGHPRACSSARTATRTPQRRENAEMKADDERDTDGRTQWSQGIIHMYNKNI